MQDVTHKMEEKDGLRAPGGANDTRDQHYSKGSRADARERRDIVSGEIMPENRLIRFVAAPDGQVVPDAAAKLPRPRFWWKPPEPPSTTRWKRNCSPAPPRRK